MVSAMSASRTHPENRVVGRLDLQDEAVLPLRVFGLTERSSLIVEKRVSPWFRLYSGLLAALSLGFTVQNFVGVIYPGTSFSPVFNVALSATQRSIYPLWCLMCTVLRLFLSYGTLSKKFAEELEQATSDIQHEACLTAFWKSPKRHAAVTNVFALVTLFILVVVNVSMYARTLNGTMMQLLQKPALYLLMLEGFVLISSFVGNCIFLGLVSRVNLARMFNSVASEVEDWANGKLKSEEVFKAIMNRHNLCWRLTDAYDRVFRNVLGTCFVFSVPIFCMVTTQVVKISTEESSNSELRTLAYYLLLWSLACVFFTALMSSFAALVNSAASAPRKHLLKITNGHNICILHFVNRLNEYKIGFTFFDFFVVEKTTILSIFSLMVTYLVVFLQMAQVNTSSSSGPPARQ